MSLTLLTRQSGALAGALFLVRDEDSPVCAASIGDVGDPLSFVPQVEAYLTLQLDADNVTSTKSESEAPESRDWSDAAGRTWTTVLLAHSSGGALAITGVVVLGRAPDGTFAHPGQTAAAISRFYADRGATSLMLAAD